MTDRDLQRRDVCQAMAGLSPARRRAAGGALCTAIVQRFDPEPMRIAGYLPLPREIDIRPALRHAIALGHSVYLPRVARRGSGHMQFLQWTGDDDDLTADAHGIAAPAPGAPMCPPERLELVLVPGTAFAASGQRLGSGAGFYDRAFAFRLQAPPPPTLLGIAAAEQRCAAIATQAWDVPMDDVLFDDQCL